jgi:AmmeMemoRadiSam system protein A
MTLTDSDKLLLLDLARVSIAGSVGKQDQGTGVRNEPMAVPETLMQYCGAFVSLYVDHQLRGCIGTFSEHSPLWENVKEMALSAATSDHRFTPIGREELDELQIEISVLSPRQRIHHIEEIIPGIHGIYMVRGANRGTLLPQVALKQNWNVEDFLGNCAKYKAGIGWDGWKTAELYTYTATVFNSEDLSGGPATTSEC